MTDQRFHNIAGPYKLAEIAKRIDCVSLEPLIGEKLIRGIKTLEEARDGDLTFLSNKKYLSKLKDSKASACIISEDIKIEDNNSLILLKTKNSYLAYSKAINLFYSPAKIYKKNIMPSAHIAKSATIGENCYIGHNVVIEENVIIGDHCIIEAGSFIDFGVIIGNRAKIYSNVSISFCEIGDDAVILSGAKIGQDGFGFATEKGKHHSIYHTGRVLIGNNVEIGANTTIDRGSLNDTIIEDETRIDNLVQIGHNVHIGRGSIIVAQVGIAGSSKIGEYCRLGGQVGIAGHIIIGNKVDVAGQAGIMQDIKDGEIVGGSPAVPIKDWLKGAVLMKKMLNNRE